MVGSDDGATISSGAYERLIEAVAGFAADAFRLALRYRDE